jgi:division/cell wall cluster transcriptional repressor MraZ
MFRGINTATLDAKGRLALPTRFRETLAIAADGKIVVTIDVREQCLLLYPLPEWDVVQRKLEGLSNIAANARRLQRLLIGHATDIELDSQGRILLPKSGVLPSGRNGCRSGSLKARMWWPTVTSSPVCRFERRTSTCSL